MTEFDPSGSPAESDVPDIRAYLAAPEGWAAHVKQNWEKEFCFHKKPGEDYFHLLMHGEVYLQHDEEKVCLQCALRNGILTHNRLNWQKGGQKS